ncbi:hypothetical protein [Lentilitoribacter sp. Alg239-R112]|uniref:hypothetical protein n=1 Tax=Lentilitoribacter sp. Alg239-R112 TaxID=2305987 RepID=UPI0013A6A7F5|nr:hypothetical protein [Lentilitoribacter sp. Alg239-R112]
MVKLVGKKDILIIVASLSIATPALAEGDLYYMHNGSPYFVWTSLKQCQYDLRNANRGCDNFGYKSFCGHHMYSTSATSNVAKDRWRRNQNVQLRDTNTNSKVCNITP